MKFPRLITRRRMKWVGLIAAATLLVVTVVSTTFFYRGAFHTENHSFLVQITSGQLVLDHAPPSYGMGGLASFERVSDWPSFYLQFHFFRYGGRPGTWMLGIPLWFPLLLVAAPTAYLWFADRRAKPWQCPKCRYDLRGLEGVSRESGEVDSENRRTICPECGHVVDHSNSGEPSAD